MTAIKIAIANIALFLILKVVWLFSPGLIGSVAGWLALPSDVAGFAKAPWTALTYMFVHLNFWHLLVNSLWLAWFGSLLEHIAGSRWLVADFLAGGIAGAASYLLLTTAIPVEADAILIGSSAATLSVVAATLISAPDKKMKLPLIGRCPLKWFAAAGLGIFLCASLEMSASQTAAHFGGLAAGTASAFLWRIITRRRMEVMKAMTRDRMTHLSLIEKARRSGYASLSHNERLELFKLSSRTASRQAPAR